MKILLLSVLIFSASGCGPTTTGNPVDKQPVTLRMADTQPFAFLKKGLDLIIPEARAAITNSKFCFKRLRFKPDSSSSGSNIDLELGQIDIDPNGTDLLTVEVPVGEYKRIEFDLEKDCDGVGFKSSVEFDNANGPFDTDETITIKFDGSYNVSSAGTLTLDIDALYDALDLVTANNQIKPALENAPGDF